jgi:hypothetical protein
MASDGALRRHGRSDGVRGALEGREESIPCRVDLVAIPRLECFSQQSPVLRQHLGVTVAQVLEETGRGLEVAEQKRDSTSRQVRHEDLLPSLLLLPYSNTPQNVIAILPPHTGFTTA